jgi:hypothetical protein
MRAVSAFSTLDMTGIPFHQHGHVRHGTGSTEYAPSAKRAHPPAAKLSVQPNDESSQRVVWLIAQLGQYRRANSDGRFDWLVCRLEDRIATLMARQTQYQNSSVTLDVEV